MSRRRRPRCPGRARLTRMIMGIRPRRASRARSGLRVRKGEAEKAFGCVYRSNNEEWRLGERRAELPGQGHHDDGITAMARERL